jgi:thioredoxin-like negative regulator of GroEL
LRIGGIILGSAMQLTLLNEFDYHHVLARTHGASLVLFSSPDCGTCRRVEKLLPDVVGDAVTALFKVDVQQATALARQYDLFHLPTLFLYRDGRFHAVLDSEIRPGKLQQVIATALQRPAQEEP